MLPDGLGRIHVEREKRGNTTTVDCAEAMQLVNTGRRFSVLDLNQPGVGNRKVFVTLFDGDLTAHFLNVTSR